MEWNLIWGGDELDNWIALVVNLVDNLVDNLVNVEEVTSEQVGM